MKRLVIFSIVAAGITFSSCDKFESYDLSVPNPEVKITLKDINGFDVSFSNESKNAKNFLWEFGDGVISTEKAPVYKYELPGDWRIRFTAFSEGYYKAAIDSIDISIPGKTGDAANFVGEYEGVSQVPGGLKIDFTTSTTLVEGENAILFGNILKENRLMYKSWGYETIDPGTNDFAKIILKEDGIIEIPKQFLYTLSGYGYTASVLTQGRGRYNADTGTLSLEYAELWSDDSEPWDGKRIDEMVVIARKK